MQKTPFGNIGFLCSIFSTFWQPSFKLEIAKWKWILAVLHQMNIWTRFSQHFMTFGSCIALSKEPYCFLHFTILRPNPLQKYCSINTESKDYFAALVRSFRLRHVATVLILKLVTRWKILASRSICNCVTIWALLSLRLKPSDTQTAVITQPPNGLNGLNSPQLPESVPSSGDELRLVESSRPFHSQPPAPPSVAKVEKGGIILSSMWHAI